MNEEREYIIDIHKEFDLTGWKAWAIMFIGGALLIWLIAAVILGSHDLAVWISGN